MVTVATQPNALKRALLLDAVASGTMGLLLAVAAAPLSPVLGLPLNLARYVGVFLVPFAAMLVWLATLAVLGFGSILQSPEILGALNPLHAITLFLRTPWLAFVQT